MAVHLLVVYLQQAKCWRDMVTAALYKVVTSCLEFWCRLTASLVQIEMLTVHIVKLMQRLCVGKLLDFTLISLLAVL